MARERINMRKTREILRQHFECGLSGRQISRSLAVSPTTVSNVIKAATAAKLVWPVAEMPDSELEALLFAPPEVEDQRALPDFAVLAKELKKKHVTLQLLWEEYRRQTPGGYCYSQFCALFRAWRKDSKLELRREFDAGEVLFVDWAGATLHYRDSGKDAEAQVFVGVLGASDMIFVDVYRDQTSGNWLAAHMDAFRFYGGVPVRVVPDNPRTATSKCCNYDPLLNRAYEEMLKHYGTVGMPARSGKPRDKGKAENGVRNVGQQILARLRNRTFTSFAEVREAVRALRTELNNRPFAKMPGCRSSLFAEVEKPTLKPLPKTEFCVGAWKELTVHPDYHIQLDDKYLSVPYTLIGQKVSVRISESSVEIYHDGCRVATHPRHFAKRASTHEQHRAPAHCAVLNKEMDRLLEQAGKIGGNCRNAADAILASYPHPEMGFRSCQGMLRLAGKYGCKRLEQACMRSLEMGVVRYRTIAEMLLKHMEHVGPVLPPERPAVQHANVRGPAYYQAVGRKEAP